MRSKNLFNLSFVLVVFISFFYNASFIKPHNLSGDAASNFQSSIYISANSKNLNNSEKLQISSRSIIVPYFNSLFIGSYFKKNKIDECYKNINLKDRGITFEERSSRLSEECKDIHTALQYFFLLLFYILIISTIWIGTLFKLDKKYLLFLLIILNFNTFYLSKILSDSTEILAAIFMNISIISIYYYSKNYLYSVFFGFSLGFLFLSKKIFIFSPIFILLLAAYYLLNKMSIKKVFLNTFLAIFSFIIIFSTSNFIFKDYKNKEGQLFEKGNHILVIRAAYLLNINLKNYFIAGMAFTPIYGDKLLKKFKNYKIVQPFLNDPNKNGRERNSIMIYANPIVLDYYMKENNIKNINLNNYNLYFSKGVINYPTIINIYKKNIFKNIICTPLFLYRSLFPGIGKDVLNYNYNGFPVKIYKFLLNLNKILNPILIITLLIFFLFSLKSIRKNDYFILLSLPIFSVFLHSFITHGLGRYSAIVIPFSIVIFIYCIKSILSKYE